MQKPTLSDQQNVQRFQFSINMEDKGMEYWENVYFVDEQRFG